MIFFYSAEEQHQNYGLENCVVNHVFYLGLNITIQYALISIYSIKTKEREKFWTTYSINLSLLQIRLDICTLHCQLKQKCKWLKLMSVFDVAS